MGKSDEIVTMQVQIASYGVDGIKRVAAGKYPRVPGVRYLVSWQAPEPTPPIPEEIVSRDDFDIVISHDRGLARNRNHALDFPSDSEVILLSDDDVEYSEEGLRALQEKYRLHPEADIICCRYLCDNWYIKNYGEGDFSLSKTPFGWYPTTFEITFRRRAIKGLRFNEKTGLASGVLIAGEDSTWFADLRRKGAKGIGAAIDLCSHPGLSTGERLATDPEYLFTHGAILTHIKPISWFPRLLLHAHRSDLPFFACLRHTLRGAIFAYTHKIFR